jgi:folate-binding protein YgfZ
MFDRLYICITGQDRYTFLNGFMTNDALKLSSGEPLFTAFLNAQGKFLFDAFLCEKEGMIVVDGHAASRDDLFSHLSKYKLRSKVSLEKTAMPPFEFPWPIPFSKTMTNKERILKGIPFGAVDVISQKGFILECGFDELGAIDWKKGCYLGQELVAKTKYRGEIRKKLMPIEFDGVLESDLITTEDGVEAGDARSREEGCALAMIRLEFTNTPLFLGSSPITVLN